MVRHFAAGAALDGGTALKTISDVLGHSIIAVTADVYLHRSDSAKRTAADSIAAALGL